jgi:multidrug efflux pump subunit AcrA (membrane-fusion protein)
VLSFPRPGTLAEVLVEDGDVIKEGQLLIRQDDAPERAQLADLQRQATDDTRVRYAQVALDQSQVELERNVSLFLWKSGDGSHISRAKARQGLDVLTTDGIDGLARLRGDKEGDENFAGPGAVSALEVERALLDVKLKKASLQVAELEFNTAKCNRDQMVAHIEQMKIISPINGRVERLILRKGESADALKEVILLIQTDPLWVELSVPMDKARLLAVGQTAAVQYPQEVFGVSSPRPAESRSGKIVFKSNMANQAGSLMIRVEVTNPNNRPAGERAMVHFDALTGIKGTDMLPASRPSTALRAGSPAAAAPVNAQTPVAPAAPAVPTPAAVAPKADRPAVLVAPGDGSGRRS